MRHKKKLIEVALPLDAINKASAREKSIRYGHPSTLHLWWARRPLAAARAVIFAQMVDDPSAHPDLFPTEETQEKERQRLFRVIEDLVLWENSTNEKVLQTAREEVFISWCRTCSENTHQLNASELFNPEKMPAFHDPFAGGGSLPLEAQRLGLEAYASDLNPVAVLINKAMIEIPPKVAGMSPVNPDTRKKDHGLNIWTGTQGIVEDVRYYGKWLRDEAEKRIGHLYPKVEITAEIVKERPDLKSYEGKKLTVIAWLWARTVKSPNPAFAKVDVPLASTFMLSSKKGKEAYIEPVIEGDVYRFKVKVGKPQSDKVVKIGTSAGKRGGFLCLMSGTPIPYSYIRDEGSSGRMGTRLMAIVAEGVRGRVFLSPTNEMEVITREARPDWTPDTLLYGKCRVNVSNYGLDTYGDLFTPRQLEALTTFSDLVQEVRRKMELDIRRAELTDEYIPFDTGATGSISYTDVVGVYLGFVISSLADRMTTICTWDAGGPTWGTKTRNTFARQAIPMAWDFAEVNPFSTQSGSFENSLNYTTKGIVYTGVKLGFAKQADATTQEISKGKVVSTDPPYYDNISYADLSDFFYVWLRRTLKPIFPDLFSTLAVPKTEELVATPYRHGSKIKADKFFLDGMTLAMHQLAEQAHEFFPVTIYYAFKQSESKSKAGNTSTGWETFLEAVIRVGFSISGTWPMRTELGNRMIGSGANALASSIVLVCRKRQTNASTATRREFVATLKAELPVALTHLQRSNIAPVDLAQAAIGPGMAVFTRYTQVLDTEGKKLSVREALALINQTLDETLAEQEGDFDADSRWAILWFEQSGFSEGDYGVAETLSKAKNTSVTGMADAGILISKGGKVRLLRPAELPTDWDPTTDKRRTDWEGVHHLIRALELGGESAAAELVNKLGSKAETARELAYRLYYLCERKKRAQEALSYNGLVQSWPEIERLARETTKPRMHEQPSLPGQE